MERSRAQAVGYSFVILSRHIFCPGRFRVRHAFEVMVQNALLSGQGPEVMFQQVCPMRSTVMSAAGNAANMADPSRNVPGAGTSL